MSVKNNSTGKGTSINTSLSRKSTSNTNSTSARKYIAKDQVINPVVDNDQIIPNAEHVVKNASFLKSISVSGNEIAKSARDALSSTRKELSLIKGKQKSNSRVNVSSFTDNDLQISQKNTVDKSLKSLDTKDPALLEKVKKSMPSLLNHSLASFLSTHKSEDDNSTTNNNSPFIDYISVELDKKKGVYDSFFAVLKCSILEEKIADGTIKAIRIFRSIEENPVFLNPLGKLSVKGISSLQSDQSRSHVKNGDFVSSFEKRLIEGSVENSVSSLSSIDPFTNQRRGSNRTEIDNGLKDDSSNRAGVSEDLSSFFKKNPGLDVDRSVSRDLKSLRNIQLQNPDIVRELSENNSTTKKNLNGKDVKADHTAQFSDRDSSIVIDKSNKSEYKEIAFLSIENVSKNVIGKYVEFSFEDTSILYGRSYNYFFQTVDKNLNESVRSRIVNVSIDGLRIPSPPDKITGFIVENSISLSMFSSDLLVEKFEILKKDLGIVSLKDREIDSVVVSSMDGFTTINQKKTIQQNDFIVIGESINGLKNGSIFYDRNIIPGRRYVYRVYVVDIFGNKSSDPKEIEVFVPDQRHKNVDLLKPNILVEVDAFTGKCGLTLRCSDPRVEFLFLSRKDFTVNQQTFVPPGQISAIKMGNPISFRGPRSFEDIHLVDGNRGIAWNGVFENKGTDIRFIDFTSRIDHTYQYQVYGVDRFGNSTSHETSNKIFVSRRPVLNTPLNLTGSLRIGDNGDVQGIDLKWKQGDIDTTSEERLGSRSTLEDNSVKSLFQLERKKKGEEQWLEFPLIEESSFFDQVSSPNTIAPIYRPPLLEKSDTYMYRVQTFQSGGFISNFSPSIQINFEAPVSLPGNFRALPSDSKVRPFYVFLTWTSDVFSGVIDHWEIQRAEINNFAAAKFGSNSSLDFKKLDFTLLKKIYRESSRFNSMELDSFRNNQNSSRSHRYIDTEIVLGNSYFYRICSVGINSANTSDWVYKGAKITDDVFEMKQKSLITDEDRRRLSDSLIPFSFNTPDRKNSSYSL